MIPSKFSLFSPERSFRTRIILVISLVFMGGIWTLSFYASEILKTDMVKSIGYQQYSTASLLSVQLNSQVQDRIEALQKVAAKITPVLLNDGLKLQEFLDHQASLSILYNDGLIIYDINGIAISSSPEFPGRIGTDYSDRDYIQNLFH